MASRSGRLAWQRLGERGSETTPHLTPVTAATVRINPSGSVLVRLRQDSGPSEMDILDYMIRCHVPAINGNFVNVAALSAALLATGER